MAENKLFDFMNVQLPDVRRSNIPWKEVNRFTASVGYIYPSLVMEVLPTDRITGNLHTILRSRPTTQSVYGSMRESHQAFFVPARLYSKLLDQLQTFNGEESQGFDPEISLPLPSVSWSASYDEMDQSILFDHGTGRGIVLPGSLLNMLNMFPGMFNFKSVARKGERYDEVSVLDPINAIPLLGYYDIIRNYYYNAQELEMPFVWEESFSTNQAYYRNVPKSSLDKLISLAYEGSFSSSFIGLDIINYIHDEVGISLYSPDPFDHFSNDPTGYPAFNSFVDFLNSAHLTGSALHHGLAVRTFDDDYFTTALNSEYVDDLNNSARVVVSNGSFSVTQMQRANRLHKHRSRNILMGNDYEDYLYVHFNAKLGREVNKPIFLGSTSQDFYFDDIYQTARHPSSDENTEFGNSTLGSRAGILNTRSSRDGFIDFTANEFGYLIVLSSIIPQLSYAGGIPRMYFKTDIQDFYSPEFDAWSFQDVNPLEMIARGELFNSDGNPYLSVTRSQPAWFEHLATYDKYHGLYDTDMEFGYSIVTRDPRLTNMSRLDTYDAITSTYIRPWQFNYLFSFAQPWFDNFEWQILFDFNVYRPISKQILPSM